MDIRIQEDEPTRPECLALLQVHHAHMQAHTSPEKIYALDASGLAAPGMTFWSMWGDGRLIGFGALKELDAAHGEIKSMHTRAAERGRGLGEQMLMHVMAEARARGMTALYLETGAPEGFIPARRLYEKHGFALCGPFGDYTLDPMSVFMSRAL